MGREKTFLTLGKFGLDDGGHYTPQKMAPFRFMQYSLRVMQYDFDQNPGKTVLPVVYTLVFYNGEKPWTYSTNFFDLFEKNRELAIKVFNEPFKLIDIKRIPKEELKHHQVSGMFEMTMQLNHALNEIKDFL